jgi:cytochrome c-type biogenesis protein CcmE
MAPRDMRFQPDTADAREQAVPPGTSVYKWANKDPQNRSFDRMLTRRAFVALLGGLMPLGSARADQDALSPSELVANADQYDGQIVKVEGIVERVRERLSSEGLAQFKFAVIDGSRGVTVFALGPATCRDGMWAIIEGRFEKANRLGSGVRRFTVIATRVTCR